jgi:hypothetical protein
VVPIEPATRCLCCCSLLVDAEFADGASVVATVAVGARDGVVVHEVVRLVEDAAGEVVELGLGGHVVESVVRQEEVHRYLDGEALGLEALRAADVLQHLGVCHGAVLL